MSKLKNGLVEYATLIRINRGYIRPEDESLVVKFPNMTKDESAKEFKRIKDRAKEKAKEREEERKKPKVPK